MRAAVSPRKSHPREEFSWRNMIQRCTNPNATGYKYYGGRGITVVEDWCNFWQFLADMGRRPNGTTLDRVDVNGNYCPTNCRWAVRRVQNNNRRNNHLITHVGDTRTISEWARITGIKENTLEYRLLRGWPVTQALGKSPRVVERKLVVPEPLWSGVYARYCAGEKQTHIAKELGIHSSAISRICKAMKTAEDKKNASK